MKKQILVLMVIGILFSCSDDDKNETQIIDMRVNHYQNTGITMGPVLTFLVQKGDQIGTENWAKFYSSIGGFTYEPGKVYDLQVKVESIDNPPADGSSIKYTLIAVKSVQDVDNETLFEIDLKINGMNFITNSTGIQILNQITIDCNDLCDELETTIQHQDFVVGTFKWGENKEIQLLSLK